MTKLAFVIMPFGKDFDSVFHKIIKPPLEFSGYRVERADSLVDRTNILKKIMNGMMSADIIIADLTNNNANVFYELGICHSKGKNVIMITQSIDSVPFDLKQYVLDSYSRDIDDVDKFNENLRAILESIAQDDVRFENPVSDFWIEGNLLDKSEKGNAKSQVDVETQDEEEEYEDGVIDIRLRLDASAELIKNDLEAIPHLFSNLTAKIQKHAEDIERAGKSKSAILMHKSAIEASETLHEFANEMHNRNDSLSPQTIEFNKSLQQLSALKDKPEPNEVESAKDLLDNLNTAIDSAEGFYNAVLGTRKIKIAKAYNKAADRVLREVHAQIDIFKSIRETICSIHPDICENLSN